VDRIHLVDKPEGWTSHDVVARLRAVLGERRIGHAGTLDPFATGLLIVAERRATGLLGWLGALPKRYRARARLGVVSDTQDRTGTLRETGAPIPEPETLAAALAGFLGPQLQRPPLYSAVKVRGERAYRAARRGEDVDRPERAVSVYSLELLEVALPEIEFHATVSRGTYLRTLAHDLGAGLGCGAHLVALRRTAIGPFRVEDALSPEPSAEVDAARFRARSISPAEALAFLPRVRLNAQESTRLCNGAAPLLSVDRIEPATVVFPAPDPEGWPIALCSGDGTLLAVARAPAPDAREARASLLRVLAAA
jgi:tRNA pseudouridine55 synthase